EADLRIFSPGRRIGRELVGVGELHIDVQVHLARAAVAKTLADLKDAVRIAGVFHRGAGFGSAVRRAFRASVRLAVEADLLAGAGEVDGEAALAGEGEILG